MSKKETKSNYLYAFLYIRMKEKAKGNELQIDELKKLFSVLIKVKKKYYFLLCRDMIDVGLIEKITKEKVILADVKDKKVDHWRDMMENDKLWK